MTALNRRDVVVGGGLAAGLVSMGHASSLPPTGLDGTTLPDGFPDASEVLRRIHLTGSSEQQFLNRLAHSRSPASAGAATDSRPLRPVQGQSVASLDLDGEPLAYGLRFVCDPRARNRLEVAGEPLVARRFAFSADQINWIPGFGSPLCTAYCPRFDYLSGGAYPEAKCHQLVPMVLGQRYFIGCQSHDVCETAQAGPVCFDVNALYCEQARGHYTVTIWSWS